MDTSSIEAFSRNGPSGKWMITHGRIVVVTLAGLYFVGQGGIVRVTCRDSTLIQIILFKSSPTIQGMKLPFPERGLELLSNCIGEELTWEAQYLRPYVTTISDDKCGIGSLPIPKLDNKKPIEWILTLKEKIEVTLRMSDKTRSRCAGLGIIDKYSPRSVWSGFLVPYSFFVVVNVTRVNTEYNGQIAYYKEPTIEILSVVINYRVLWSGYKVRPIEPLSPTRGHVVKKEDIGSLPIRI